MNTQQSGLEPRVVIVYRETRLDELKRRYNTLEQARFYVEHLGADFDDYVAEDQTYKASLNHVQTTYQKIAKVQLVDRSFLSNFIFAGDETIVVVGQDGLVANTLKYVRDIPVVGVNPEPQRYDGVLLPFNAGDISKLAPETIKGSMKGEIIFIVCSSSNVFGAEKKLLIFSITLLKSYNVNLGERSPMVSTQRISLSLKKNLMRCSRE